MMYPVLAKVRYDKLDSVTGDKRLLVGSLVLNWLVGPALMFALAWIFLPDLPAYRTGLIIVGLARCIAMVIIWNDLACGDREAAAVLVALNSVFQVVAFAGLGWFYLSVLPGLARPRADRHRRLDLGDRPLRPHLPRHPARSRATSPDVWASGGVGEPGTRRRSSRASDRGRSTGCSSRSSSSSPCRASAITSRPLDVARIALPLLVYFAVMWGGGFRLGCCDSVSAYERTTTLAFTAAGNNFELAIAVAIATFGATSGQALAGVVGPLIEVPALVALVYVSLALRRRFRATEGRL